MANQDPTRKSTRRSAEASVDRQDEGKVPRRRLPVPKGVLALSLVPVVAVGAAGAADLAARRANQSAFAGNVPEQAAKVPTTRSENMGVEVPDLTSSPGVNEEDLPPSLQPQQIRQVTEGQGAEAVVAGVSPEALSGPGSTDENRQAAIDHVQEQGLGPNHMLVNGQLVYVGDPHPGSPSPALPEDPNTHVG